MWQEVTELTMKKRLVDKDNPLINGTRSASVDCAGIVLTELGVASATHERNRRARSLRPRVRDLADLAGVHILVGDIDSGGPYEVDMHPPGYMKPENEGFDNFAVEGPLPSIPDHHRGPKGMVDYRNTRSDHDRRLLTLMRESASVLSWCCRSHTVARPVRWLRIIGPLTATSESE